MKKSSKKIYLFPATMLGITAISGSIAMMTNVSADDLPSIDDNITITVDSACTMGQTVTSSHTTELNPGETNNTIGQSRIAAYCNDSEGYAIYAIGYTNSEYGNTNLVSTDGNHTIPTGTSGNSSYWNMRLTQGTATGPTSYLPTMVNEFTTNATIPNDYTKVAYRDSSTISQNQDPTETGSYFTTTYSAHIDTTQPAGIYTGQVQYVMVHPASAPKPEIPPTYMQDTATIKQKLANVGDTMQAVDSRDGKKYWITKMTDGKIWMTQNLDLDLNSQTALTPENTNISANWTPANSTISFTGTSMSGWTNSYTVPYSADPGELYVYSSGTTDTDTQYISLADCQAAHSDCSMHNHAGNYYNWSAAVASNNTSRMATRYRNAPGSICPAGWRLPIGLGQDYYDAASREWNVLLVAKGIMTNSTGIGYATDGFNNIRISPLWLARSGRVYGGSLYNTGYYGGYWSSTVSDSYFAYQLRFHSVSVDPANYDSRDNGYSVRCLAE